MSLAKVEYPKEFLTAIYELGCLFLEMGYFAPAEKIFSGLAAVDNNSTPAKQGLGVIKLEQGLPQESLVHFRAAIQNKSFQIEAKVGIIVSFMTTGEFARVRSMLKEVRDEAKDEIISSTLERFLSALQLRCDEESSNVPIVSGNQED